MLKVVVAEVVSDKTGPWLKAALQAERVQLAEGDERPGGVVSLGVEVHSDRPALNANAGVGRGKLAQLEAMAAARVQVPRVVKRVQDLDWNGKFYLGRQLQHTGGKDIKLYLQPSDLRYRGESNFYVQFVPSVREWRAWIFRGEVLAIYEKVLAHRELLDLGVGRNERNGFVFEFRELTAASRGLAELGVAAVAACKFDFGAVDILEGVDGQFYALEVNTAPGANGRRAVGLVKLAKRIAKWERDGYPRRS